MVILKEILWDSMLRSSYYYVLADCPNESFFFTLMNTFLRIQSHEIIFERSISTEDEADV